MGTEIRCACGRQVEISDDWRRQVLDCPFCGALLVVPPGLLPERLGNFIDAWCISDRGGNFVVLTEAACCIGSVAWAAHKQVKQQLEAGAPVGEVLGPSARIIPLAAVQAVQCSYKEVSLSLGYFEGPRKAEYTIQYVGLWLDETFAALRKQLGRAGADRAKKDGVRWHEERIPSTAWSAMSFPLIIIGTLLLFFGLAYWGQLQDEAGMVFGRGGRGRGLAGLMSSSGWLVGGVVVAVLGLLWLVYAVLARRPAAVQITRLVGD
jgi:hypothetical protein